MNLTLGIDLACRAAHQASLARPDGSYTWTGKKFFTHPHDLERIWADLELDESDTVTVVLEPTRNAWTRNSNCSAPPGTTPWAATTANAR